MSSNGSVTSSSGGLIACVESLAAETGAEILRAGGNAADAAIATAFAQGVVDPIYCGIAGGFHGIFHDAARGLTKVIMAGGRAPLDARADMWQPASRWGALWSVEGQLNRLGYQASMVPGFVRGAEAALQQFGSGRISWRQLIQPAIRLAAEGFEVYPYLYRLWMQRTDRMLNFLESLDGPAVLGHTPSCRAIYLHADGGVYEIGERLVQIDYAHTLERLAEQGPAEFYEGDTAQMMVSDFQAHGGLLSAEDLRRFTADVCDPATTSFRGLQVLTEPAPTVGLITLEILNILEPWDLASLGWNSPEYLDRLVRAMHVGFRDRMAVLGDPDFVDVPQARLLSPDYAAMMRQAIEEGRELDMPAVPTLAGRADETTHVSVVDRAGNAAAITHSLGMSSGVVNPGLGFQHNCHMSMFDPVPGRRNSIAPWKRPVTGGGPALFLNSDGKVFLMIGSPAGARKVTAVIQALLNVLDFGMPLADAVSVDRVHTEDEPRMVIVEPHFSPQPLLGLARRGHRIRFDWYTARLAAVLRHPDGSLEGGSDPRGDRGLAVV
ncbi:MAG: gamma-glutamyltransferase [Chloroflexi bacterium]|nr:gamma-glutamyltransferase [Chloroflexota bacterium]MBV9596416.1 gamma-glutamyltransferase [Chloroflexota bacterium]